MATGASTGPSLEVAELASPTVNTDLWELEEAMPLAQLEDLEQDVQLSLGCPPAGSNSSFDACCRAYVSMCVAGCTFDPLLQRFENGALPAAIDLLYTSSKVYNWSRDMTENVSRIAVGLVQLLARRAAELLPSLVDVLEKLLSMDLHLNYSQNNERVILSDETFVKPLEGHESYGRVAALLHTFHLAGGLDNLLLRLEQPGLTSRTFALMLRPFRACAPLLTAAAVAKYFVPIIEAGMRYFDALSGALFLTECKEIAQHETLGDFVMSAKRLLARLVVPQATSERTDKFALAMLLKLLRSDSYNGTMYALNEIRRLNIEAGKNTATELLRSTEWLTKPRLADWLIEENIVALLFKERLHQAQYVSKVEDVLFFLAREHRISDEHLSIIWLAQLGKHETIVNNVFPVLLRLAPSLEPPRMDHLFALVQRAWGSATECERLLLFLRRLGQGDSHGEIALKVVNLLWQLARDPATPPRVCELALDYQLETIRLCTIEQTLKTSLAQGFVTECCRSLAGPWSLYAMVHLRALASLFGNDRSSPQQQPQPALFQQPHRGQVLMDCVTKFQLMPTVRDNIIAVCGMTEPQSRLLGECLQLFDFVCSECDIKLQHEDALLLWDGFCTSACECTTSQGLQWFGATACIDLSELFEQRILHLKPDTVPAPLVACIDNVYQKIVGPSPAVQNFVWRLTIESPDVGAARQLFMTTYLMPSPHSGMQRDAEKHHDILDFVRPYLQPTHDAQNERFIGRVLQFLGLYCQRHDELFRHRRTIPPHRRSFKLSDETITLTELDNPSSVVKVPCSTSTLLCELRHAVAHNRIVSDAQVLLFHDKMMLGFYSELHVLSEMRIGPNTPLTFRLLPEPAPAFKATAPLPEGEVALPSVVVASDVALMDLLVAYSEYDHPAASPHASVVRDSARMLLATLPTHQVLLKQLATAMSGAASLASCIDELKSQPSYVAQYRLEAMLSLLDPAAAPSLDPPCLALFFAADGIHRILDLQQMYITRLAESALPITFSRCMLFRLTLRILRVVLFSSSKSSPQVPLDDPAQVRILDQLLEATRVLGSGDLSRYAMTPFDYSLLVSHETATMYLNCFCEHNTARLVHLEGGDTLSKFFLVFLRTNLPLLRTLFTRKLRVPIENDERLARKLFLGSLPWLHTIETQHPTAAFEFFDLIAMLTRQPNVVDEDHCNSLLDYVISELQKDFSTPLPTEYQQITSQSLCCTPAEALLAGHLVLATAFLKRVPPARTDVGRIFGSSVLVHCLLLCSDRYIALYVNPYQTLPDVAPRCLSRLARNAAMQFLLEISDNVSTSIVTLVNLIGELIIHTHPSNLDPPFDYTPLVHPRLLSGYVGLKNACATCYMNSVIQQLFMQTSIRQTILAAPEVPDWPNNLLSQMQNTFLHLHRGLAQYFIPDGVWQTYRHYGQPVSVREQQDAREFFDNLVDQLDAGLAARGLPRAIEKTFGGVCTDVKKINSGCQHEYEKDDVFMVLSLDVRHQFTLANSLQQHIKPELLEGYKCEKCDAPRDCVKRVLFKTLPNVLAVQLKRFDYDWERGVAIKFNDLFEFPTVLDMAQYTLAHSRGEAVPDCRYRLVGVVVHSGQASGGHYYSFCDTGCGWLKFDDTEVTAVDYTSDFRKETWFGGEFTTDVYDHQTRTRIPKVRERWWNAYMLFYQRMVILPSEAAPAAVAEPTISATAVAADASADGAGGGADAARSGSPPPTHHAGNGSAGPLANGSVSPVPASITVPMAAAALDVPAPVAAVAAVAAPAALIPTIAASAAAGAGADDTSSGPLDADTVSPVAGEAPPPAPTAAAVASTAATTTTTASAMTTATTMDADAAAPLSTGSEEGQGQRQGTMAAMEVTSAESTAVAAPLPAAVPAAVGDGNILGTLTLHQLLALDNWRFRHNCEIYRPDFFEFVHRLLQAPHPRTCPPGKCVCTYQADLLFRFLQIHVLRLDLSFSPLSLDWSKPVIELLNCTNAATHLVACFSHMNFLRQYLLECPHNSIRHLCAFMVFRAIETRVALDSGAFFNVLQNLVTLAAKDLAQFPRNSSELFVLLTWIGDTWLWCANILLENRILSVTIDLLHQHSDAQPPIEMRAFYTLALNLVRKTDVSRLCALPTDQVHDQPPDDNPLLLKLMPEMEDFLTGDFFIGMAAQACHRHELEAPITHLCRGSFRYSIKLIENLVRAVDLNAASKASALLANLLVIANLNDQWQDYRLQAIFRAEDPTVSLYNIMIKAQTKRPKKTYLILKFLRRVQDSNAAACAMIKEASHRWEWALTWLRNELHDVEPSYISPHSNEQPGSHQLERSDSALELLCLFDNSPAPSVHESDDETMALSDTSAPDVASFDEHAAIGPMVGPPTPEGPVHGPGSAPPTPPLPTLAAPSSSFRTAPSAASAATAGLSFAAAVAAAARAAAVPGSAPAPASAVQTASVVPAAITVTSGADDAATAVVQVATDAATAGDSAASVLPAPPS